MSYLRVYGINILLPRSITSYSTVNSSRRSKTERTLSGISNLLFGHPCKINLFNVLYYLSFYEWFMTFYIVLNFIGIPVILVIVDISYSTAVNNEIFFSVVFSGFESKYSLYI